MGSSVAKIIFVANLRL